MRIIGNKVNVNVITFIHNGKDMKFQCIPTSMPYAPRSDLEEDKRTEIIFDDLLEVDELIVMLECFRKECSGHIGSWQKK